MKKAEVVSYLAASNITRHNLNAPIYDAFVKMMREYRYGRSETAQAYHFFALGWALHREAVEARQ